MKTSKLEQFKHALWNPQTKTCLGRSRESWLKLIAFYIALYSCLAAIWAAYFHIFHLTISDKYPKWQLEESLIGTNPGLGVRPLSPRRRVESALISFRDGAHGDYGHWVADLSKFIEANKANGSQLQQQESSQAAACAQNRQPEDAQSFCPFEGASAVPEECSAAQNYSFPAGKPCILVKLNRIYGWKPQPYQERPAGYPEAAPFTPGNIQITCEGQQDADKEHVGPIEYYPSAGIETRYYPFLNQPGYQSPYVMVHFKQPKPSTLIYVECKAWARNVEHDRYNRKGLTSFELFIEKSAAEP